MPDHAPLNAGPRSFGEWLAVPIGATGCLVLLGYFLAVLAACFAFLEDYWNWHWFVSVVVIAICLRVATPLLVLAALFGAWIVWDWPFLGALAFAMPGLVVGVAVLLLGGIASVLSRLTVRR